MIFYDNSACPSPTSSQSAGSKPKDVTNAVKGMPSKSHEGYENGEVAESTGVKPENVKDTVEGILKSAAEATEQSNSRHHFIIGQHQHKNRGGDPVGQEPLIAASHGGQGGSSAVWSSSPASALYDSAWPAGTLEDIPQCI